MTTANHFFTYCGVHYKTCPVELREEWASIGTPEKINEILKSKLRRKFIQRYKPRRKFFSDI